VPAPPPQLDMGPLFDEMQPPNAANSSHNPAARFMVPPGQNWSKGKLACLDSISCLLFLSSLVFP
jgi:hypothetical protein